MAMNVLKMNNFKVVLKPVIKQYLVQIAVQ